VIFFSPGAAKNRRGTFLLLGLLFFPRAVFAQSPPSPNQERPLITATTVEETPLIDGRLDDPVWQYVTGTSEFYQREPVEGEAATEETTVYILYDQTHLYIGVELLDSDPLQIRASDLQRDSTLDNDDSFTVAIDSFHDHRNAFVFRLNPLGTRYDAVIRQENHNFDRAWDEQWTAAAVRTDQGWSAEFSIPFKILRFSGAEEQVWGINFERIIKRKNESAYWSGWERDFSFYHISQAGHLEGLIDIKQAERLRIRPYVLGGVENFAATSSPLGTKGVGDVGIDDLKIAVTSNLTADLAFNPDFGQVEVDAQQVNLTRFSLFFREKRPFFIEGAESLRMGLGLLHFGPPPVELFHSRRVGLSDSGAPIPIMAGSKLTGKVGAFDLGFLNVQTNEDQGQPGENFTVARFRREMLGRSYVGAIFTNRQGGGLFNRLAGVDARFVLKRYFHINGMLAKSFTSGISDKEWLTQIGLEWRADFFTAGINYMDIEPNFIPGIGFLRRRDRTIGSRVILKPRPGGELIRNFEIQPSLVYYHNEDKVLKSRNADLGFDIIFQSGDKVQFDFGNDVERLFRPFRIAPGVILSEGLYQWNAGGASFSSFNGRKLAASAGFSIGDFYNGTKNSFNLAGELRPNEKISFSPSYKFNDIDLIEGSFNTHLFGLRTDVSFTNNLLTSTFLQYNSTGDLAALQVRFNYIFRTIDNFFIVYNETRFTDGVFSGESDRSLILKITYSLHR